MTHERRFFDSQIVLICEVFYHFIQKISLTFPLFSHIIILSERNEFFIPRGHIPRFIGVSPKIPSENIIKSTQISKRWALPNTSSFTIMKGENYLNRRTKVYENLELSDDFMFAKVMLNKALCRELLEMIMGVPIADITYLEEQKVIDITMHAKSVRLDAYVADDRHTVYDVEMQTVKKSHLPQRSRYYGSMIDLNLIEKGMDYRALNPSFVIFICTFDPFKKGRCVYSFENRCLQDMELSLEDGTGKIFLNADGTGDDISDELKAFLNYLSTKTVESDFVERLDQEVKRVRKNRKWRREYMTLQMKLDEVFEEAREDGLREGRETGLHEGRETGLREGRETGLREGRETGLREGRAEGRAKERIRTINIALGNGMSKEDVKKFLNATDDEIAASTGKSDDFS